MRLCHQCKKAIEDDIFAGRQTQCPSCGADLHCCMNCSFYDPGSYNDCREPQAERVLDKNRSNFCDFFKFRQGRNHSGDTGSTAKEKLDTLFKKK